MIHPSKHLRRREESRATARMETEVMDGPSDKHKYVWSAAEVKSASNEESIGELRGRDNDNGYNRLKGAVMG
ncbi:hypothetical protein DdX_06743 [Ditylenchus destructor]|uniref:Uncharacterized protein n=1 Tax=Ditylenchus destructor TaxID=166010 RepID=A0AAD4N8E5_9BILA|nr:hypothetical protein DdX_06743 [Ditylenchus destructor]